MSNDQVNDRFVVVAAGNTEVLRTHSLAEAVQQAQRLDARVERLDNAGNRTGRLVAGRVADMDPVRDLGVHRSFDTAPGCDVAGRVSNE